MSGDPLEVSPGEAYVVDYAIVQRVMQVIPAKEQRKIMPLMQEIKAGVVVMRKVNDCTDDEACAMLIDVVKQWCNSAECSDPFGRRTLTWLQDRGYLEPPEAWSVRRGQANKNVFRSEE